MTNAEKLKRIMKKHDLTRPNVAAMLGVSLSAVDGWLNPEYSAGHRKMADRWIDYLNLKIQSL